VHNFQYDEGGNHMVETETETETISPGHACGCECKQYFNKNATV
jgi:hypothetical protein